MKKPEFILFDYGETLVHEKTIDPLKGSRRMIELAAHNPLRLDGEALRAAAIKLDETTTFFGYESGFEMAIECYQRILFAQCELSFDLPERVLAEEFWRATFENEPVAGAEEIIRKLNAEMIPYGIVSNISLSGESLDKMIRKVLPECRPKFTITSADYFFRKPNPILMEIAVNKAGVPKDGIWFVGDKLHRDAEGARNVGITPILFDNKNRYSDPPVPKIERLSDLAKRIDNAESLG